MKSGMAATTTVQTMRPASVSTIFMCAKVGTATKTASAAHLIGSTHHSAAGSAFFFPTTGRLRVGVAGSFGVATAITFKSEVQGPKSKVRQPFLTWDFGPWTLDCL